MKVIVRVPKRVVHEFPGRRSVGAVVSALGFNPESVIVIREGDLLTPDVMLGDEDVIEVRPAISGG